MEFSNKYNLTEEELDELVALYNKQVVELKELSLKVGMYEEWAFKYKKENEELKMLLLKYENELDNIRHEIAHLMYDAMHEEVLEEEKIEEE